MQISNSIIRRAQYHETDSMKIVHHANYVKWMEEARLNYFKVAGFDWKQMEETTGIMIPVLFQSVDYEQMIKFDDEIEIACTCERFNGVKMDFSYVFKSINDRRINAKGITKHGFLDKKYNPISLNEAYKEGFIVLNNYVTNKE